MEIIMKIVHVLKLVFFGIFLNFSCSILMSTDSVKGTITDEDTSQPIEGVSVTVETVYSPKQYNTKTNTNGYYEIKNITKGGGLVLTAEKNDYNSISDGFEEGDHTKNYKMKKTN
jgi:hypothetical protein